MSVFFLLAILTAGFAVAFFVRRGTATGARVTEPSCGKCGYCVRGLTSMTCPECGSDLREVGIRTPGSLKPMATGHRLLVWTLIAPLPAFLGAQILSQLITPWIAITQQQRVIFLQAPKLFATVRAEQEAQQTVLGRSPAGVKPLPPMKTMTLRMESNRARNPLEVDIVTGASTFNDAAGKPMALPFDARAIEQWFNAHGFTDTSVAPLSQDMLTAVNEIGTPAGRGFTKLAPNPQYRNLHEITAHPTFGGFTTFRPTRWGPLVFPAIALLIWLMGLPFVFSRAGAYNPAAMHTKHDFVPEPVGLDVDTLARPLDWPALYGNKHPIELEIGMGKGTFLTEQAKSRPEVNFFGIEWARWFWKYASDRLRRNGCDNARTVRAEAGFFLTEFVPPESLSVVHIYFPDPWPKARHHKRRLIQPKFMPLVARVLMPGGRLQVVTDHQGYWEENIEGAVRAAEGFQVVDYNRPGSAGEGEFVGTNFERKYAREGRPFYAIAAVRE